MFGVGLVYGKGLDASSDWILQFLDNTIECSWHGCVHTGDMDAYAEVKHMGGGTYLQMASKHSSMVSLWALVRERPLDSLYIVCSVESIKEV